MKLKILIGIETIVLVFFIVLATIKTGEAEKHMLIAEELYQKTIEIQEVAQSQAEHAEKFAAEAVAQVELAKKALEACKSSK